MLFLFDFIPMLSVSWMGASLVSIFFFFAFGILICCMLTSWWFFLAQQNENVSVWDHDGAKLNVFKSWVNHRFVDSRYPGNLAVRVIMATLSFSTELGWETWIWSCQLGKLRGLQADWQSLPLASCVIQGWQQLSIFAPRKASILDVHKRENKSQKE